MNATGTITMTIRELDRFKVIQELPRPFISDAIEAWFNRPTSALPPITLPSSVGARKRPR